MVNYPFYRILIDIVLLPFMAMYAFKDYSFYCYIVSTFLSLSAHILSYCLNGESFNKLGKFLKKIWSDHRFFEFNVTNFILFCFVVPLIITVCASDAVLGYRGPIQGPILTNQVLIVILFCMICWFLFMAIYNMNIDFTDSKPTTEQITKRYKNSENYTRNKNSEKYTRNKYQIENWNGGVSKTTGISWVPMYRSENFILYKAGTEELRINYEIQKLIDEHKI